MDLSTNIEKIKGVGPKMAARFHRLGIETVEDLIYYYPRRYKDFTQIGKISDLLSNRYSNQQEPQTIRGQILSIENKKTSRKRFVVTEAIVDDNSGSIKVVWFNQPFLIKQLFPGREVILNGKISFNFYSKEVVMESPDRVLKPMIVPVYPETAGLSSHYIWRVQVSIQGYIENVQEFLPSKLLQPPLSLMSLKKALAEIHQPSNSKNLEAARRRIAFDELFLISARANLSKKEIENDKAPIIKFNQSEIEKFIAGLPFSLTNDQYTSSIDILKNISLNKPMNRLLNGDVGSGKTVVAVIASYAAVLGKYKVLVMAPTEILAIQHYNTFSNLLDGRGIKVGLYTANKKCDLKESNIIIGTQALIQKSVEVKNIGLVIVDEQHRFGVKQRAALQNAVSSNKFRETTSFRPHFLSMTATPIPRTMHLALFGDLDLSLIKEKPSDRKEIKTRLVEERNRSKAYEFIRKHLQSGRQAFVICPLIEEKESNDQTDDQLFDTEDERKTVVSEYGKLKQIYPEYEIGMLHGKMKAKEKDEVMAKFKAEDYKILVSTSVVEVGVDVPNASIMIIEDAERFGLAQLHQFRGRVGRGEHQSFCFLFSSTMSPKALNRLKMMEETSDGFKLAEFDLETRGPGSIYGTEQSGLLDLKMANFSDRELMLEASNAAKEIVKEDPKLSKYPLLKEKVSEFIQTKHME